MYTTTGYVVVDVSLKMFLAFSLLRLFLKEMEINPENADMTNLGAICLRNFCSRRCGKNYINHTAVDYKDNDHQVVPGIWHGEGEMESVRAGWDRNPGVIAKYYRDAT